MSKKNRIARKPAASKAVPAWSLLAPQPATQSKTTPSSLTAANQAKQHLDAALAAYQRNDLTGASRELDALIALGTSPHLAFAYDLRGVIHARQGQVHAALADFRQSIALDPHKASSWSNLANALLSQQQYAEALTAVESAVRLDPSFYNARYNQAIIQSRLGQTTQAIATFEQLATDFPDQFGQQDPSPLIDIKKQICDWNNIRHFEQQARDLLRQQNIEVKWPLVHISNHALTGDDELRAMRLYANQTFGHLQQASLTGYDRRGRRLRVAYVSADFCDHATTRLMAAVFEAQSHTDFEYYAITHSPQDGSEMRQRVLASFDHVVEVSDWSDQQVADYLHQQQIDIAIDLKGYTGSSRLGIFARRVAPVQITYLGFPGTTGSAFMDYIIGDRWVTPLAQQSEFSERILQLPHCYQPNDPQRYLPAQASGPLDDPAYQHWRRTQREAHGIPADALVLCCFNNTYKLHPDVYDIWLRILARYDHAVLWLLSDKPATESHLKTYASQQDISAERICFAPRSDFATYLDRYLLADLFVDTLAYNAHTTGSDALWMGVPLVTCAGSSFAARVGASLLNNVGLPELITPDLAAYEQLIDQLCSAPHQLQSYSQYLRDGRAGFALFDAVGLSRDLEQLYRQVAKSAPMDHAI